MPRLSGWFVRTSLIYLATGISLGALMLVNKSLGFNLLIWKLLPVHSELLLIGWFVLLAVGVAYWILPRVPGEAPRGNVTLAWLAFWLINLGITIVILQTLISLPWLLFLGRLVELGGVVVFVVCSWNRIKSFRD